MLDKPTTKATSVASRRGKEDTMLKPVFSVLEHQMRKHHCDAALLKCVDFRLRKPDLAFAESQLGQDFDVITWPGAAKALIKDLIMSGRIIGVVREVCRGLHSVNKVMILNHWDCGGYGGSKNFASVEEEEAAYRQDLAEANDILTKAIPELEIILAYSKLEEGRLNYYLV